MNKRICVDQLAGGGVSERIQREFNRLAENVLDPNTKADATRKITVEITIKPNKNRQMGDAEIVVKSSLAPTAGLLSSFVFDFGSDGKAAIAELNMSKDRDQTALSDSGEVVDGTGAPVQQMRKVVNGPFR